MAGEFVGWMIGLIGGRLGFDSRGGFRGRRGWLGGDLFCVVRVG